MTQSSTNLGVKPLGRGQAPSEVIARENAIFKEYQAELKNAARAAWNVAKPCAFPGLNIWTSPKSLRKPGAFANCARALNFQYDLSSPSPEHH